MNVLIIEDDPEVIEAVSLCFQARWPDSAVRAAGLGSKGLSLLKGRPFDIVILDLNLPDMSGFDVLRRVRAISNVPVIILSARDKEEDQAGGLEAGADDYVTKPFRPRELMARVTAVLRRTSLAHAARENPSIARGKLTLHLTKNELHLGSYRARLTPTECMLLYVLMKNAGATLDAGTILHEVWGKDGQETELLRTYIRRLRSRLRDSPPQIILTDHREGYRFVSPD